MPDTATGPRQSYEEKNAFLRAPIAGDQPAGPDVSFEPAFEKVKAEIDKLTALTGGQPNWFAVEEEAAAILATTSKDLRIAVWLSAAKAQRRQWEGLAEATVGLSLLVREFWDTMHPDVKRGRARSNLLGWFGEQMGGLLSDATASAQDADALEVAGQAIAELDALFTEKLGELYTGMGRLGSIVASALAKARAAAPAPAPTATPEAATSGGASPDASASASAQPAQPLITSGDDDPLAVARECARALAKAAQKARRTDGSQAFPYVLSRVACWLTVRALPSAEGKTTRLPPPPPELQRKVDAHRDAERWLDMLDTAEQIAADHIFWIDQHRNAALALERLGESHAPARDAVVRETLAFVERFPTLTALTFSDGTPFANAGTVAWLEGERKKRGGGTSAPVSTAISEEDEAVAKRFAEARDLVAGGKIAEGLGLAQELAARGADGRTRFRARLAVARLTLEAGEKDIARATLESLMMEADRIGLETWDPPLCAAVYASLLEALEGRPGAREVGSPLAVVFDRLCRLDPAAALRARR